MLCVDLDGFMWFMCLFDDSLEIAIYVTEIFFISIWNYFFWKVDEKLINLGFYRT